MTFISYAQNFEDVMLWRALGHIKRGFYIDVGAQSPDLDSVTRAFSEAGWWGINVEPHPDYFAELMDKRPRDVNLRCALGEAAGVARMHMVGRTGLSTLDPSIASRHLGDGHLVEPTDVVMDTLDAVWVRHVPPGQIVHFLKVDVEGFEAQVLRGHDWRRHRPWIVLVEATAPNSPAESFSQWEPALTAARYDYVYADGLNRYYLAQEMGQLRSAFRHPPNVFDDFVLAPFESVRQALKQELATLESTRGELALTAANLAETQKMLAQSETALASVQGRAEQQESALRKTQVELAQREESLTRSKAQLSQLAERRDALLRHIAKRDQRLNELTRSLEETIARADKAEADLTAARAQGTDWRLELDALYGSKSWRITAPARYVWRRWRRLVG